MTDETTGAVTDADLEFAHGLAAKYTGTIYEQGMMRLLAVVERDRQRQETPDVAAAREAVERAAARLVHWSNEMGGLTRPVLSEVITAARALERAEAGALTREQEDDAPFKGVTDADRMRETLALIAAAPCEQGCHTVAAHVLGGDAPALTREQEDAVIRRRVAEAATMEQYFGAANYVPVKHPGRYNETLPIWPADLLAALGVTPAREGA